MQLIKADSMCLANNAKQKVPRNVSVFRGLGGIVYLIIPYSFKSSILSLAILRLSFALTGPYSCLNT